MTTFSHISPISRFCHSWPAAEGPAVVLRQRWRSLGSWFRPSVWLMLMLPVATLAQPAPGWQDRLRAELEHIDGDSRADIGVYVRDLYSGQSAAWKADESWYLASTIKLPVALSVLRSVQRGVISFDTPVTLRVSDYVDGAGPTNGRPVGSQQTVAWLLHQMMVYSDNTASDMLIGLVGLRHVNALVQGLVPQGFQPITSLADVRRQLYSQLTPAAVQLTGHDFLQLKQQRSDTERRLLLGRLLQVPVTEFKLPSVRDAYAAYYATGLNSARLDAYGELLAQVVQGKVLDVKHTAFLLDLMERSRTGPDRIKAGLPTGVRWAHKTGTQSARTCDSGVITVPRFGRDRRVLVAACTRGEFSMAGADRALRQVGAAICRCGLLGAVNARHDPTTCPVEPATRALRHDAGALAAHQAEPDADTDAAAR